MFSRSLPHTYTPPLTLPHINFLPLPTFIHANTRPVLTLTHWETQTFPYATHFKSVSDGPAIGTMHTAVLIRGAWARPPMPEGRGTAGLLLDSMGGMYDDTPAAQYHIGVC